MAIDSGLALAFLVAGLFLQGVATALCLRSVRALRLGGSAIGTVVGSEERIENSGPGSAKRFYLPMVQFVTSTGARHSFTADFGRTLPRTVGSPIRVVFDPQRPQQARVAEFGSLWLFPILIQLFTLPFLLPGLFWLLQ